MQSGPSVGGPQAGNGTQGRQRRLRGLAVPLGPEAGCMQGKRDDAGFPVAFNRLQGCAKRGTCFLQFAGDYHGGPRGSCGSSKRIVSILIIWAVARGCRALVAPAVHLDPPPRLSPRLRRGRVHRRSVGCKHCAPIARPDHELNSFCMRAESGIR
jgi:hypothetical protein